MDKENRPDKIRKLEKLYDEFRKIKFPPLPLELAPEFADWDGTIAGIVSSYIKGAEKGISTPLSVEEMLANYEKDMKEKYLIYNPSSEEGKKTYNEFLAYKAKLDEMVEILKELV